MSVAQLAPPADALQQQIALLYTDHHGWLHGWLRKKLGCAHNASDVAHDTFVRLLSREEAVLLHEPRAFLTTLAQRVLANRWRREQIERAYLEALAQVPPTLSMSPEERAILLETLVEIDQLLDGLAPIVRRAFLLAQLDGMAQAEIAQVLGISLSSVKRYLVQAGAQCYFALHGG